MEAVNLPAGMTLREENGTGMRLIPGIQILTGTITLGPAGKVLGGTSHIRK
jgi:hypothetical protein